MNPSRFAASAAFARLAACFSLFAVVAGCRQRPEFPRPFLADRMVQAGTGLALVAYLGQRDATTTVCDRTSQGPHIRGFTADDFDDLTDGFVDGQVPPDVWQRCVSTLLKTWPIGETTPFSDSLGRAYRRMLRDSDLEKEPPRQAKLEVLHQIFLKRPLGANARATLMSDWIPDLRQAIDKGRLGPVATKYGQDLLTTLDIEAGLWKGLPVTVASIDELFAAKNEAVLMRFTARLPDAGLRAEAKRRVVRLHIAASDWPEVRDHASDVEAVVVTTGFYAVDPTQHAPVRAELDMKRLPVRSILARQDIWKQVVALFAFGGQTGELSVMPELNLRGALQVEAANISRPITLCAPPDNLAVTPCLGPASVKIANSIAYLDKDGNFHFAEHIRSQDAVALVRDQPDLRLPVEVAGQSMVVLDWELTFERPRDLVFEGPTGGRAPNLSVRVEQHDAKRFLFTVNDGRGEYVGAVQAADAGAYLISSRGGTGATGFAGSAGTDGSDGSAGSPGGCGTNGGNGGDGTNGGNGGNGGPGGNGGNGGDVRAEVVCVGADCGNLVRLSQNMVRSEAGAPGSGGAGGPGGRGGRGGPGGSGGSCTDANGNTTYSSPGSSGHDGMSGSRGMDGPSGAPGLAGRVDYQPFTVGQRPLGRPTTVAASVTPPRPQPVCTRGMVAIPGGSYKRRTNGEVASISPFCVDVTEVTMQSYLGCVSAGACGTPTPYDAADPWAATCNWRRPGADQHPVNCIDWARASAFCGWSSKRLLSGAEFEWVQRNGDQATTYPWGNTPPTPELANGCGSECAAMASVLLKQPWAPMYKASDSFPTTAPVGSFPKGKNRWGVLDLSGNVWEWTSDVDGAKNHVLYGGGFLANLATAFATGTVDSEPTVLMAATGGVRCAK